MIKKCRAPSCVREWAIYAWGPSQLHKKKKKEIGKKEKQREEKKEKKTHLSRFHQ